ncbi:MAG: UDP-3-O-acyl-N-acetylglucosamine deacetylase [Alphaproteobacteria bacterium]|nr:UDP-3-O-acyl-N-acetylglucosamine deacetylase [Alphaproteobacteria bacterium]
MSQTASCRGVGLHSGAPVSMTVRPSRAGTGILFRRTDLGTSARAVTDVLAINANICDTTLSTTIANAAGTRIATIEHLMAAFFGCGIDNALVELDSAEVPVMDGSAAPFVALIEQAVVCALPTTRAALQVLKAVEVRDGEKWARVEPAPTFSLAVAIDFASEFVARQKFLFEFETVDFARDIAPARTFGFIDDVDRLRAMGLARGGSLANAVMVGKDGVLNEGGLRFPDEFVRHKVLDCLGDFALAGLPIAGRVSAFCAGHKLNADLVRQLLADRSAWRTTATDGRDQRNLHATRDRRVANAIG